MSFVEYYTASDSAKETNIYEKISTVYGHYIPIT